jgi:hypothetical protein
MKTMFDGYLACFLFKPVCFPSELTQYSQIVTLGLLKLNLLPCISDLVPLTLTNSLLQFYYYYSWMQFGKINEERCQGAKVMNGFLRQRGVLRWRDR